VLGVGGPSVPPTSVSVGVTGSGSAGSSSGSDRSLTTRKDPVHRGS
jgi:hypothetical protein